MDNKSEVQAAREFAGRTWEAAWRIALRAFFLLWPVAVAAIVLLFVYDDWHEIRYLTSVLMLKAAREWVYIAMAGGIVGCFFWCRYEIRQNRSGPAFVPFLLAVAHHVLRIAYFWGWVVGSALSRAGQSLCAFSRVPERVP